MALYTRRELNIRTTANFLLTFAAWSQDCRPYLARYYKSSVILPSDWIEIAELYVNQFWVRSTCSMNWMKRIKPSEHLLLLIIIIAISRYLKISIIYQILRIDYCSVYPNDVYRLYRL